MRKRERERGRGRTRRGRGRGLWVKMLELSLYFCLFVVSNKKNTFKAKKEHVF